MFTRRNQLETYSIPFSFPINSTFARTGIYQRKKFTRRSTPSSFAALLRVFLRLDRFVPSLLLFARHRNAKECWPRWHWSTIKSSWIQKSFEISLLEKQKILNHIANHLIRNISNGNYDLNTSSPKKIILNKPRIKSRFRTVQLQRYTEDPEWERSGKEKVALNGIHIYIYRKKNRWIHPRTGWTKEGEELAFYSWRDRSIFAGRFVFVFCRSEPLEPTHCSRIQDGVHRHLCSRQCCQQHTPLHSKPPPFRRPNAI